MTPAKGYPKERTTAGKGGVRDRYADYGLRPFKEELQDLERHQHRERQSLYGRIRPEIRYARKHGFSAWEIAFTLGIEEEELAEIER